MRRTTWNDLRAWMLAALVAAGSAGTVAAQQPNARPAAYSADSRYYQAQEEPAPPSDYEQLLQRLQAAEAKISALENTDPGPPPVSGEGPGNGEPSAADGAPSVSSAEQRIAALEKVTGAAKSPTFPSVRLSGFFHLDAGAFGQDANNRATLGDIQDGVGFRRARLQAVGSVSEFTNYSLEMDFATAGRPSFMDVWGEQTNLPFLGNLRIGHFRQATSMDSLTSIRQLDFLERSIPFQALDPFRRVGAMAYDKSDNEMWSWAYGVYRTGGFNNAPIGDSRFATDIGDQGGFSGASRVTHLLYYDEGNDGRQLLHVGGHYNYSRLTGSTANAPFYQARAIPEFFVGDPAGGFQTVNGTPSFVDTGRLAANSFDYYGAQLAGQYGAAHFQAEYLGTTVNQIGNPNVHYNGGYVQGGYFLTGEHRSYNRTFGTFDKITPYTDFFGLGRNSGFCGWGAWELTSRVSYINLNDPNAVPIGFVAGAPNSPDPGRLTDTTLGVNWYWNAYSNVQFNWIHCFLDNAVTGNSDCDIYCARFQVGF